MKKPNYERELVKQAIDIIDFGDMPSQGKLSELQNFFSRLNDYDGLAAEFAIDWDYEGPRSITIFTMRPENDEEYDKRIRREECEFNQFVKKKKDRLKVLLQEIKDLEEDGIQKLREEAGRLQKQLNVLEGE